MVPTALWQQLVMLAELELALWRLMWRVIFTGIVLLLRIFWLPILIIATFAYVVLPALGALAQLLAVVLQPATAIAVALLLLWLWRR